MCQESLRKRRKLNFSSCSSFPHFTAYNLKWCTVCHWMYVFRFLEQRSGRHWHKCLPTPVWTKKIHAATISKNSQDDPGMRKTVYILFIFATCRIVIRSQSEPTFSRYPPKWGLYYSWQFHRSDKSFDKVYGVFACIQASKCIYSLDVRGFLAFT